MAMFLRLLCVIGFFWVDSTTFSEDASPARGDFSVIVPEIEKYVDDYKDVFHVPGISMVIIKDGKVYPSAFGTLSLSDKTPVDLDTVFPVASVTKNFTATLIAILAQKNVLSFDDKVIKYLPDFKLSDKDATENLLVRDLLCHCVGLEDFAGDSLWHGKLTQKEVLNAFATFPFVGKLRQQYAYSNLMVGIAGLVVEKATGKSLSDVMREEIFEPLGMNHTTLGFDGVSKKVSLWDRIKNIFGGTKQFKYAIPHDIAPDLKAKEVGFHEDFYLFPGSCGVNTTANDIAKYLTFILNDYKVDDKEFISPELIQKMQRVYVDGTKELHGQQFPKDRIQKAGTGLGWFIFDYGIDDNRIDCLNQMGGTGGVRALLTIVPKENLGMAILSNLGGMRSSLFPEAVTQKFLDLYLKIEGTDPAKRIHDRFLDVQKKQKLSLDALRLKDPKPHSPLKNLEGIYKNKLYGDIVITATDDKNLVLSYRGGKVHLKHINGDQFMCMGRELSSGGFESNDPCFVEFGYAQGDADKYAISVSLLDEGEDPLFYRESKKEINK